MTLVLLVVDVATVSLIAVAIAIVSLLFFGRRPLRAGAAAIIGSLRRVAYFLVGLAVLFAALWSLHVARWVTSYAEQVTVGPAVRGRNRFDPDRVTIEWRQR